MSWREAILGECARFLSGGTPKKAIAEYWNGDIPWVGSGEMSESFIRDTALRVTREGAENGSRLVPENTVLVVVRGMSLAKEFRISLTMREMTFNQDVKALICAEGINSKFLFYALKARKDHIRDLATDASHGTKKLETDQLRAVAIKVPDTLDVQDKVVSILSAYDDLIENNRRRIALLEQAARLLYREWFVHLRFPSHETAKIVDGLPEGIKLFELGQVCRLTGGNAFKMHLQGRRSGQLPFIKVGDMNSAGNSVAITEANHWVDDSDARELKAKPFAKGTVVFAKIGEALKQNRVRFLTRDTLIDNNLMAATPNLELVSPVLLFCILANYDIASHASGAAVPFLSAGVLSQIRFAVPDKTIMDRFDATVGPILAQMQQLSVQNANLTRARDLMLPRLMDGRIPV